MWTGFPRLVTDPLQSGLVLPRPLITGAITHGFTPCGHARPERPPTGRPGDPCSPAVRRAGKAFSTDLPAGQARRAPVCAAGEQGSRADPHGREAGGRPAPYTGGQALGSTQVAVPRSALGADRARRRGTGGVGRGGRPRRPPPPRGRPRGPPPPPGQSDQRGPR